MAQFSVKTGWPDGTVAQEAILAADAGAARTEVERRGGHVFEVRRQGLSWKTARQRRGLDSRDTQSSDDYRRSAVDRERLAR